MIRLPIPHLSSFFTNIKFTKIKTPIENLYSNYMDGYTRFLLCIYVHRQLTNYVVKKITAKLKSVLNFVV